MTRRRTATPTADETVPWPGDLVEVYVARGWWRGNALGAELLTVADAHPDTVALVDGPLRMTYRSLATRADARFIQGDYNLHCRRNGFFFERGDLPYQ